jgi:spore germination cell wall hydrolase CwlJ-like protein
MKIKYFSLLVLLGLSGCLTTPVQDSTIIHNDYELVNSLIYERKSTALIKIPFFSPKDIECLARNIYYESGAEPLEGKVAVAIVTINRSKDQRFGSKTLCGIVNSKTIVSKGVVVCQFSWACGTKIPIKKDSEHWKTSKEVAENIARGDYSEYSYKYRKALFFHAISVKPSWAYTKRVVARIGGHVFYE